MKIRPWLCALLMWSLLGGLTACSDSSEEVAALKAQVEELQAQVNATSTRAPAVTEAPATTRAPATTTTQARFTAEEEAWIESELSTFVDEAGLGVTKIQARCIMKGFVEARGITGAGELLERVDAELNSGGRLSASDADAFLEPVVACANLVGITRLDIRRTEPSVDASCMVNGLQESQVADWYRTAYVEGEEVALAAMEDWMSSRIPVCMATTTTRAPATTTLAPQSPHTFSYAEITSLTNACPTTAEILRADLAIFHLDDPEDCRDMVQYATNRGWTARGCNYQQVKLWVGFDRFRDAEWPLMVERECG